MLTTETRPEVQTKLFTAPVVSLLISMIVVAAGVLASVILSHANSAFLKYWPLVVLIVSVGLVVTLITLVKLHAFVALMMAAMAAGLMTQVGALTNEAASQMGILAGFKPEQSHWVRAVELSTAGFGKTCWDIGVVIALASVIGMCLLESGAADKVVRRFLRLFGEKRAGLALLVSTYIVSIPIFFDTIFMLLVPLAKALRLRTGRDYVLYVMAICAAGAATHSMVIPHPGPAAMAEALKIEPGLTILVGLAAAIIPVAAAWLVSLWVNRQMDLPLVETPGSSLADLEKLMDKPEEQLPGLIASLTPVLLPVILIGAASFVTALGKFADTTKLVEWLRAHGIPAGMWLASFLTAAGMWLQFLGNRNIALLIGTFISIFILMRQRGMTFSKVAELIGPPLETAGVVILITAAGGAFGLMLRSAGVGNAIKSAAGGYQINLIVLAWVVAVVIRIAQGSATVAMLTTAGMVSPMMGGLPYHPVYIFLAIGWGALGISWMNDSGFWVVSRLSGFTEKQTLKSWSIITMTLSVTGLISTLLLSRLLPWGFTVIR